MNCLRKSEESMKDNLEDEVIVAMAAAAIADLNGVAADRLIIRDFRCVGPEPENGREIDKETRRKA